MISFILDFFCSALLPRECRRVVADDFDEWRDNEEPGVDASYVPVGGG